MLKYDPILRTNHRLPADPSPSPTAAPRRQQRLLAIALISLVISLASLLYHDRDLWLSDYVQTQEDIQQSASTTANAHKHLPAKSGSKQQSHSEAAMVPEVSEDTRPSVTPTRTMLPPLVIEVIAGDGHHKLRTGSNSVQVNLARGSAPAQANPSVPVDPEPVPESVTSKAAERVQVSANAASIVTHSVTPAYPTLARQMKVQGSVILQAVIGRDGLIEDLQILSGPPILAGAAKEAVRQWHFKPHYLGAEPVETQAKITVNFTISTN